jgi:hypothetical protein
MKLLFVSLLLLAVMTGCPAREENIYAPAAQATEEIIVEPSEAPVDFMYFFAEVLEFEPEFDVRNRDSILFVRSTSQVGGHTAGSRYFLQGENVLVTDAHGNEISVSEILPQAQVRVGAYALVVETDPGIIPSVVSIQAIGEFAGMPPLMPPYGHFPHEELVALRNSTLEEIGGLAFNQGYHFMTEREYWNYALITGWRPFESLADAQQYIPQLNLPETVGDFHLYKIYVDNGTPFDSVRLTHESWRYSRGVVLHDELPQGVFTLYSSPYLPDGFMPVYAFYAVYRNSAGQYVGLGAIFSIGEFLAEFWGNGGLAFSAWETSEYGVVHFRGEYEYELAIFGEWPINVTLSFHDATLAPQVLQWLPHYQNAHSIPAERYSLEELVRLFNPQDLVETYDWISMLSSLQ